MTRLETPALTRYMIALGVIMVVLATGGCGQSEEVGTAETDQDQPAADPDPPEADQDSEPAADQESDEDGDMAEAPGEYPSQPINLVVPWAAGGGSDIYGRVVASVAPDYLGVPVTVRIRAGGAHGSVGTSEVIREGDPHSLLFTVNNSVTLAPHAGDTPYTYEDLKPVIELSSVPLILVASAGSDIQSMDDLVAEAQANPGELTYGTAGVGDIGHIAFARFFKALGDLDLVQVPFEGGAGETVAAALGGQIDLAVASSASLLPHMQAGTLRGLAVSSEDSAEFEDLDYTLPGARELAIEGHSTVLWRRLFVSAQVDDSYVTTLRELLAPIGDDDAFMRLTTQVGEPAVVRTDGLEEDLRAEDAAMAEILAEILADQ